MDKKLRETTNLCVEIMNSKRQVMGETWSRGTNSRLPFDVNVMLNLSNLSFLKLYRGYLSPAQWTYSVNSTLYPIQISRG